MIEFVVRSVGPALVVTFELEAPTRLTSTASSAGQEARLEQWIAQSPAREAAVEAALADRRGGGGSRRQEAWAGALGRFPGFVDGLVERALACDTIPPRDAPSP